MSNWPAGPTLGVARVAISRFEYLEAAPHRSVERGGERRVSGQQRRDRLARQLENLAMGARGRGGCVRRSREQADLSDILSGADATDGLDVRWRLSGQLEHTGGNHVERSIVGALGEEAFPGLRCRDSA